MLEQQLTFPNPDPGPQNDVVTITSPNPNPDHDPDPGSQNDVARQGRHHETIIAQAVKLLIDMTNVSTTFHSSGDYNIVTDATATVTPRREIQAVRCDVCKIHCDTVDMLEKHKQGKRHKKNMQKTPVSSAAITNISESNQNENFRQMAPYHSGVALDGDLAAKKNSLLLNGASLESVIFCEVCSVASIGQDQFDTHLAGKKHAAKVKLRANYSESVPSLWCEICKIKCNGMDILNNHKLGKKHLKNLEKLNRIIEIIDPPSVASPVAISIAEPVKTPGIEGQSQILQPTDANLSSIVGHIVSPAASDVNAQILPACSVDAQPKEISEASGGRTPQPMEISEASGGKTAITGSLWCEICKIGCNSHENLRCHQAGRKHLKNLKNLDISEKFIGPLLSTETPVSTPIIGPMQNHSDILPQKFIGPLPPTEAPAAMETPPQKQNKENMKRVAASNEDLETKKRKIVQEGTSSDAVKACEICNVVCNSSTSFISHLAGKKHIAMAVKQAEAGVSVPCA